MFGLINKILIALLTAIVSPSNFKKCVSLSNQKCIIQPTVINLHPNEYSQEFQYYPFAVKLDRCVGSCNTVNDSFIKNSYNLYNVDVSVKNVMYMKKIMFGILLHVVVKL